jgi:hypothetical protein
MAGLMGLPIDRHLRFGQAWDSNRNPHAWPFFFQPRITRQMVLGAP